MRNVIICIFSLLLFGCVTNQMNYNGENNVNNNVTVQPDLTVHPNATVQPGALEFSVPSELPVAYVGKPYFYSFCEPETAVNTSSFSSMCGKDVTAKNPTGGKPPYSFDSKIVTGWKYVYNVRPSAWILNFTPEISDAGQYVLEVCATGLKDGNNINVVCKNTTLYVMSDVVTVKGDGELTHYLLLKLNTDAKAADFAGHEDVKNITTRYVPTASFSPVKLTAEVPAATQCANAAWCGGGSRAEFDVAASATGVSTTAEGSAACGRALVGFPEDHEVDYYHVGWPIGYGEPNIYIALNITNTGTKEKAIDVYLNISSGLDPGSQKYFKPATANAHACIGDRCVSVPNAKPGEMLVNSTVLRVLVRPGSHLLYYVGSMKDSGDNTNMLACPSFVKASSSVSVTIVPADMSDGKKAIGSIYSHTHPVGSDVR